MYYNPIDTYTYIWILSYAMIFELTLDTNHQSKGGRFPLPQTTKGGAAWSSSANNVGVVLVGDSLRAFPPDLGQGVNSALKDVALLGDSLRNASQGASDSAASSGYVYTYVYIYIYIYTCVFVYMYVYM